MQAQCPQGINAVCYHYSLLLFIVSRKSSASRPALAPTVRIIGGKYRGRKLAVRTAPGLRPTGDRIRETVGNWLQADIPNATCIDLFAGSGALGLEALSRGARQVYCIDTDAAAINAIQQAASRWQAPGLQAITGDGLQWLTHYSGTADIIFLDPPFASELLAASLVILAQHPALHTGTRIYIESRRDTTVPLPAGWHWQRHKTSGDIQYGLASVL